MKTFPLILIVAPLLLTGRLSAQEESAFPGKRRCVPAVSKKELPPVSEILDTAIVASGLSRFSSRQSGTHLLSLRFGRGETKPILVWAEPSEGPDSLIQLLAAAALPRTGGATDPWAVRLQVRLGPRPDLTPVPALYCPPVPNRTDVEGAQIVQRVQIQPGDRMPASRSVRLVAEAEVLETGLVAAIRIVRSSGVRELDEGLVELIRGWKFRPALLEGMPVPGRYRTDGSTTRP